MALGSHALAPSSPPHPSLHVHQASWSLQPFCQSGMRVLGSMLQQPWHLQLPVPLSCCHCCCLERSKALLPSPHLPLLQGKSWSLNVMAQKSLSVPTARVGTTSRAGPRRGTVRPTTSVKTVSAACASQP